LFLLGLQQAKVLRAAAAARQHAGTRQQTCKEATTTNTKAGNELHSNKKKTRTGP